MKPIVQINRQLAFGVSFFCLSLLASNPVYSQINALPSSDSPSSTAPSLPNEPTTPGMGGWKTTFKPYAQQVVRYSDNINLAPKNNEQGGFISSSTLGFNATANTARLNGVANYSSTYNHYFGEGFSNNWQHQAFVGGSAELAKRLFYIDAQGGVTRTLSNLNSNFSSDSAAGAKNQDTVVYGSISPYLTQNLGDFADAEARYTHSRVYYDRQASSTNPDSSYSNEYSLALKSDPRSFSQFGWTAKTNYSKTTTDDLDQSRWSSYLEVKKPITAATYVTGTIGYDRFWPEYLFSKNISGVYGNVGIGFVPTPRFNSYAFAGWRYGGFDAGGNVNYALTEQMSLTANAGRSISLPSASYGISQFQANAVDVGGKTYYRTDDWRTNVVPSEPTANNLAQYYTTDFANAFLVNKATNQGGVASDPRFGFLSSTAITDSASAGLFGTSGLNQYSASAFVQRHAYQLGYGKDYLYGFVAAASRNLTPRLNVGADLGYSVYTTQRTKNNDNTTFSSGITGSYRLTETVDSFARYGYTNRWADQYINQFKENTFAIGVRATF